MKLEITQKGVFDANGDEVSVGTVINVKGDSVPAGLLNKCHEIGKAPKGAELTVALTGPVAVHKGGGSWSIMNGDVEVEKGVSKDDADAFNAMSDQEKLDFIAEASKPKLPDGA
jgi:hypothetical protein